MNMINHVTELFGSELDALHTVTKESYYRTVANPDREAELVTASMMMSCLFFCADKYNSLPEFGKLLEQLCKVYQSLGDEVTISEITNESAH